MGTRTRAINDKVIILIIAKLVSKPVEILNEMRNEVKQRGGWETIKKGSIFHAIHESAVRAVVIRLHDVLQGNQVADICAACWLRRRRMTAVPTATGYVNSSAAGSRLMQCTTRFSVSLCCRIALQ